MANIFDQFDNANSASASTTTAPTRSSSEDQNGNIFDQFDTPNSSNTTSQQQTPDGQGLAANVSNEINNVGDSFDSMMESFNRQFGQMAENSLIWGSKLVGAGNSAFANNVRAIQGRDQASADSLAEQHPIAAGIGSFAGNAAKYLPMTVATGGMSLPAQIGLNAAGTAAMGALETDPNASAADLIGNTIGGGLMGAGGTVIGSAVGSGLSKLAQTEPVQKAASMFQRLLNPKAAAAQTAANEIGYIDKGILGIQDNMKNANDVGVNLTWPEASGSESALNLMKNTAIPNPILKGKLMAMDQNREADVKGILDKTIADITPEGTDSAVLNRNDLYDKLKNFSINKTNLNDAIDDNPLLAKYITNADNNKAWPKEISDLPSNNAFKVNEIRRLIGQDITNNKFDSTELMGANKAKTALTDILNNSEAKDTFNNATAKAKQVIFQKQINDKLATVDNSPGAQEGSLNQVYNKLWNNPKDKTKFLDMVSQTGGDSNKAEKLINVINSIRNDKFHKLANKEIGVSSISAYTNKFEAAKEVFNKLGAGRYNKELLELLTNTSGWDKDITKLLAARNRSYGAKALMFKSVLGKVGSFLKSAPGKAAAIGTIDDNTNSLNSDNSTGNGSDEFQGPLTSTGIGG